MAPRDRIQRFVDDQEGGILVFWGVALVVFLGLMGLIFDAGRLATTQSELQSFADSSALAAAAELDGKADSITRARAAAQALISDTQTYANGGADLSGSADLTLTFYEPAADGGFARDAALVTTNPYRARFVDVDVADRSITLGFGAAFAALSGNDAIRSDTSATAVAGFSLEACNVAPVAMCLPTIDFDAEASVGETLELQASVSLDSLLPGQIAAVDTITNQLDGLSVCAGLAGAALDVCLLAAREPETACTGQGGLVLSADIDGNGVMEALSTRVGQFQGVASSLVGNTDFLPAPNVLTGETTVAGLCLPLGLPLTNDNVGLPADDCFESGACALQGDGDWSVGRDAYVAAHYDGTDPFPAASTRFEFYQAEIQAAVDADPLGGLLGGALGGFTPQMCAPQANLDPTRRLFVVAGIDCLSASVDATVSAPPVSQFFEVFVLGPTEDGALSVEISACLGGGCGGGELDTEVRDIVRLVE